MSRASVGVRWSPAWRPPGGFAREILLSGVLCASCNEPAGDYPALAGSDLVEISAARRSRRMLNPSMPLVTVAEIVQ